VGHNAAGGLEGLPKPPALGDGPAEPGRPSVGHNAAGGLEGGSKAPRPRSSGHNVRAPGPFVGHIVMLGA